jgi:hypothetical protein
MALRQCFVYASADIVPIQATENALSMSYADFRRARYERDDKPAPAPQSRLCAVLLLLLMGAVLAAILWFAVRPFLRWL